MASFKSVTTTMCIFALVLRCHTLDSNYNTRDKRGQPEPRPVKELEIPEIYMGDLLTLESHHNDVFRIKSTNLEENIFEIHEVTGTIRVKDDKRLDYEKTKQIELLIEITRRDDPTSIQEQPVVIKLTDINDELPHFVNVPRPFLSTVQTNAAPGTSVYHLMAQDADAESDIQYNLESGGEDRFEVDHESGVVRTKGNQPFHFGKEYEIGVSAQDRNAPTLQKSPTHSLKILVGERNPQFFETHYVAQVSEAAIEEDRITTVKAFSHQGYPVTYELTTESGSQSGDFAVDQNTGVVDLLRRLDYENDSQRYHLRVKGIENGRPERTSTVSLIINLVDENDNTPTFPLSQYIVQGIAETVAVGTDIIQVTATDLDSVTNSQLTYSVSDGNFTVQSFNNIGYIKTSKRLDYDMQRDHTYNFTVLATDNGVPAHSGSAMVRVTVTNVNDEDPVFMQAIEHVQVSEDASPNTLVHVVQAYDPDGDDITYSFKGGSLSGGPFNIDSKSGIITLVGLMDKSEVSYKLNVTATDNGRCCGGSTSRSSKGLVIVEVKDINNNAPKFPDCHLYNPTVREKEVQGTSVIKVSAVDFDTGANGNITYSIVKSSDQSSILFFIEPISGILKTADIFDREAKTGVTDYGVTVKAEDHGSPQLAGFCTFRVKIGDTNDNPPVFDFHEYTTSLEESSNLGKKVVQVYATDRDAGENGRVEYKIVSDSSGSYFKIDPHSGWITIIRGLVKVNKATLRVQASDRGTPALASNVTVKIDITKTVNAYPQWVEDYSLTPIKLSENAPRDYIVKRLRAISTMLGNPYVNYIIQQGDTPEQNGPPQYFHSRIDEEKNEMLLMVYNPLDYEVIPKFTLTIKAANRAGNSISNDTRVTIELLDENDEIPQFVGLNENGRYLGSVAENMDRGTDVITVTATDRDHKDDYSRVRYSIKDIYDHNKFNIDPLSGLVTTSREFDREGQSEYYIMVVAEDGAKSDRPNHSPPGSPNRGEAEVQIRITDKNDNTPFFKERTYYASVPENTDMGAAIITVTAEDRDEENQLTYSIVQGNIGNAFEVRPEVGEIKVRGKLDYENGARTFRLKYRVFDDKFANTTTVVIHVTDVNDNPPKFDNAIYNVTGVMEEEPRISESSPKFLLQVRANDPDTDRDSNIIYSLSGQFAKNRIFKINERSGEIFLTRSLDRDQPRGRPVWNFNVLAHDEPGTGQSLTGYAEVRVMPKDINDNAPVFDRNRLVGRVMEDSRAGISVMTVIATDADAGSNGSVSYSLKQVPMKGSTPLFSIDSSTGLISTQMSKSLDREEKAEYRIIVQAKDRGAPPQSSSATVTIQITDINDHKPKFTQKIYRATMSESYPKGGSITSVSATDMDEGNNARLTYTLAESGRQFFSMTSVEATNTGVLKVFKPVDYDSLSNPFFNLTVYVRDPDISHIDTAHIEVFVTDYNDNPPQFSPSSQKVSVFENITIGRSLARFRAEDKDTGMNGEFEFSIERSTDPHKQFAIDGNGLVTTAKFLDRETSDTHRIHVLAIDKGEPAQTGVGTLIITLVDVNDNFPVFAQDYRPVVYENEPSGQVVIEVSALDKDTATNGPPFEFWLPCGGGCPCSENPTCHLFGFMFKPGGGHENHGSGIVRSLTTFDRESRKEYYMPIIMKDSGKPYKSGTNTLTIIIGDKNDNAHKPGHKDIFVYNYKGAFKNVPLGNVYAEDEDDWDVTDKSFKFVDEKTAKTFRLDEETGILYTRDKINEGRYNFEVRVYDKKWLRKVFSSVTITVAEIGDDAVFSSGSMRLTGVTAEEFTNRRRIGPATTDYGRSKYDLLRSFLAKKLGIPTGNVDIFTVMDHPELERTIDIRYAAHNSPYYRAARLDGLVAQSIEEIEEAVGIKIAMVPVDECLDEKCESGGCSNILVTTNEPSVINTNGTSLIGVTAYITAECTCAARKFERNETTTCHPESCYNGGTCHQRTNNIYCECPPTFDGPRCQQTRHSFSGNGWAWYKSLSQCEDSHTSIEFITTKDSGLIMYNGPIKDNEGEEYSDFIILELRGGYPVLRINHGSGEAKLTIDGRDTKGHRQLDKLNDGTWHRVDIFRTGKVVRLVVDQCKDAVIEENENAQTSSEDRRPCEAIHETPGANKYINVNTPLQLGGRTHQDTNYPRNVLRQGFEGCLKNLVHNGELYDLHIGVVGEHLNSEDGCPREDVVCGLNDIDGAKCGVNGTCVGSFLKNLYKCICKPGWRGPKCAIPTTTKDFHTESYIEWDFKTQFYMEIEKKRHLTDLQLMFRTRQASGLLFKAQNAHKSEYITLEVADQRIQFRYNLGSGENKLLLSYVNVSDGQWHTVFVERVGMWVTLKLDGGEGKFYNYTLGSIGGHLDIRVSQRSLFAGGDVRFSSSNSIVLVDDDYKDSCMNDVRFGGEWFPMDPSQNEESNGADVARSDHLGDGCESDACIGTFCPLPLMCVDLWRVAVCQCPYGQRRVASPMMCENINECLLDPCVHGECIDKLDGFECRCYEGYEGELCPAKRRSVVAHVSMGAILAIVICALVLLLVVLLFIIYSRRRRPQQYVVGVDPDDDVRENIIHYDEEGVVYEGSNKDGNHCDAETLRNISKIYYFPRGKNAGEEDQDTYDINRLKKPIPMEDPYKKPGPPHPVEEPPKQQERPRMQIPPGGKAPDVGKFIKDRLQDTDYDPNAPPHDSVREYAYEGAGSDAGSISSLASTEDTNEQDFDYLNNWGPRFNKLANMYGEPEPPNQ